MIRPSHLPNYIDYPLHEVVMGVQFAPPHGYQQIYAGEVWQLFRRDFPKVRELQPLQPSFETFGLPQGRRINLGIVTGASHDRFWFMSENEDEIIQFQQDRLLHNWRRVEDGTNPYPQFENIFPKFEAELYELERYFINLSSEPINVNQCEVTYLNHIILTGADSASIDKWMRLVNLEGFEFEDLSFNFRKAIKDSSGEPRGRLICESSTGVNKRNEPLLSLNLTVRGAPQEPRVSAALSFIREAREIIVKCFDDITTEFAHEKWGRE